MPRKIRVEYAGAINHVMSRGNRREGIYLDDGEGGVRTGGAAQERSGQAGAGGAVEKGNHPAAEEDSEAGASWDVKGSQQEFASMDASASGSHRTAGEGDNE